MHDMRTIATGDAVAWCVCLQRVWALQNGWTDRGPVWVKSLGDGVSIARGSMRPSPNHLCYLLFKRSYWSTQAAHMSLTNCPTLPPSGEWLRFIGKFSDIYLPLSHLTPSTRWMPSSCRGHIWLSYNLVIDGLSRLGTIHQRGRHTDRHVAVANAAPTHCDWQQKVEKFSSN